MSTRFRYYNGGKTSPKYSVRGVYIDFVRNCILPRIFWGTGYRDRWQITCTRRYVTASGISYMECPTWLSKDMPPELRGLFLLVGRNHKTGGPWRQLIDHLTELLDFAPPEFQLAFREFLEHAT